MLEQIQLYRFLLTVLWIVLAFDSSDAQTYCSKVDFNRPTFTEFQVCQGKFLPTLVIKDYNSNRVHPPFRPTSKFFLTNTVDGYSCAESTAIFYMNANTRIEAAIYLKSVSGSFFEIVVYDSAQLDAVPVYSWKNESSTGWYTLNGVVRNVIPSAKIEIRAYMNAQSALAVEYINVLNLGIQSPECTNDVPKPTTPPPKPTTPPPKPTTNKPQNTTVPNPTTKPPSTQKPPTPQAPFYNDWQWIVIIVLLALLLIVMICVCIYCVMKRNLSRFPNTGTQ